MGGPRVSVRVEAGALVVARGVLRRRVDRIPLPAIRGVVVRSGWWGRRLGLSTLQVFAERHGAPSVWKVPGVKDPDAARALLLGRD